MTVKLTLDLQWKNSEKHDLPRFSLLFPFHVLPVLFTQTEEQEIR